MCALGEMAAWLPLPSGFTGYAVRFVDPALGFTLGWTYVFLFIPRELLLTIDVPGIGSNTSFSRRIR